MIAAEIAAMRRGEVGRGWEVVVIGAGGYCRTARGLSRRTLRRRESRQRRLARCPMSAAHPCGWRSRFSPRESTRANRGGEVGRGLGVCRKRVRAAAPRAATRYSALRRTGAGHRHRARGT
jgi:hypothetical protein